MQELNRGYAYVRVSTDEQAREGLSLGAQEERIRAYCSSRGIELERVYREEGISAAKPLGERPEGAKLAKAVAGFHVPDSVCVVVFKVDRLWRSLLDGLRTMDCWGESDVVVHVVELGRALNWKSAQDWLLTTIQLLFAEYEWRLTVARTNMAMAVKRARGDRLGGAPLEAPETLARIYELADVGVGLRQLARTMNDEGWQTMRGGKWAAETVRKILARRS